jgi:hypothetical protein
VSGPPTRAPLALPVSLPDRTGVRARGGARPAASVAELRRRADRAIGTRLNSGKPLTAAWLGEAARISAGAALALLREHVAAGRLTRQAAPGGPAPFLDVYTRPTAARSARREAA